MRQFQLLALGLLLCVALAQNDCNNPLLQRSDIKSRFGDASNILSTPATLASGVKVCTYLVGKATCVKPEGYAKLEENIKTTRDNLVAAANSKNKVRFANVSKLMSMDMSDCMENIAALMAVFTHVGLNVAKLGSIDFTSVAANLDANITSYKKEMLKGADMQALKKELEDIRGNSTGAFSKCAKHVMEGYLYSSCEATNANYNNRVSGTSDSPKLKVKKGFCSRVKGNCKSYLSGVKTLAGAQSSLSMCLNSDFSNIVSLIRTKPFTADTNTKLNTAISTLMTNNLAMLTSLGSSDSNSYGSKVSCSATSTYDEGCNFVCASVLTATGFKQNAFLDLDPSSTTRLLQGAAGAMEEADDDTLSAPDTAASADTSSDATAVTVTGTIDGGSSFSSILNLGIFAITAIIGLFF